MSGNYVVNWVCVSGRSRVVLVRRKKEVQLASSPSIIFNQYDLNMHLRSRCFYSSHHGAPYRESCANVWAYSGCHVKCRFQFRFNKYKDCFLSFFSCTNCTTWVPSSFIGQNAMLYSIALKVMLPVQHNHDDINDVGDYNFDELALRCCCVESVPWLSIHCVYITRWKKMTRWWLGEWVRMENVVVQHEND